MILALVAVPKDSTPKSEYEKTIVVGKLSFL